MAFGKSLHQARAAAITPTTKCLSDCSVMVDVGLMMLGHPRELARVHRQLASVRKDVGSLQAEVGAANDRLVQSARTQGASMRRTLRDLGLTQLHAAATTAAAMGHAVQKLRRQPSAPKKTQPKAKPRIAGKRRAKTAKTTRKTTTTGTARSTPQRRITASGRTQPSRPSRTTGTRSARSPKRSPAKKRPRR